MAVKRNYRINLRNYGNPPAVMVSQYDENYSLTFEVYDGPLPASGLNTYTVKLVGTRADTLKYSFDGTVTGVANNVLNFTIDTTMTACAGKGVAEIVILDATNDVKFASFNLPVYVEKAAVPDDAVDADVERAQEIAEEVQEIVDTAAAEVKGEAEAWAVGQRDGEDVPSTDPAYENNAKFYAEQAAEIVEEISDVTDQVATNTNDISDLKEDLSAKVSTVNGIEPDAGGNVEIEASGVSDNAVELLIGILNEGLYGTNQSDNIIALNAELRGNVLSSISAVLNGIPLIGMPFADLDFTVTATYSDGTTAEVSSYTVSDGTVVSGSNTATITYRGKSTTVTFTASYVTAYTITYNLTDVTSSNMTAVVAGESSYTTTLSIASGYSFGSCTVTMGGVDVTSTVYSNMEILIQSVTGNIVITANAVQETILDPLIRTNKNVEGVVFAYSDNYQTQVTRINNSAVVSVTEYPALNTCTLKWTLTNTSEEAVSISAVGLGCISAYDSSWHTDSYVRVAYWQSITIQGGSLGAGGSLEGYYNLPAGYQFVFINNLVGKDVLTLSLSGAYVADTFTGYSKVTSTGNSTAYGSYRTFTWYSDNGVTELLKASGSRYVLFDESLGAGTYDVVYRIKGDVIALSATADRMVVGAVTSNSDTSANNSVGYSSNIPFNIWLKGTLGVSADGMTLVGREGTTNGGIIEMYCKEVA